MATARLYMVQGPRRKRALVESSDVQTRLDKVDLTCIHGTHSRNIRPTILFEPFEIDVAVENDLVLTRTNIHAARSVQGEARDAVTSVQQRTIPPCLLLLLQCSPVAPKSASLRIDPNRATHKIDTVSQFGVTLRVVEKVVGRILENHARSFDVGTVFLKSPDVRKQIYRLANGRDEIIGIHQLQVQRSWRDRNVRVPACSSMANGISISLVNEIVLTIDGISEEVRVNIAPCREVAYKRRFQRSVWTGHIGGCSSPQTMLAWMRTSNRCIVHDPDAIRSLIHIGRPDVGMRTFSCPSR